MENKIDKNKISAAAPAAGSAPANKASAQLMNQQETYLKDSTREGSSFLYAIYAKKNYNSIVNKFKQIYDLNNLLPFYRPTVAALQSNAGGVNITCTGESTIGVPVARKIIEPKNLPGYLEVRGGSDRTPQFLKKSFIPAAPFVSQNADADQTRERMKDNRANRELTQAQKDHIAKLNENCNTPERIVKSKKKLAAHIAKSSKAVEITNIETGKTVTYESQREAARQLGINHNSIRNYIKSQKLFLGKYKIAVKGQVVSMKENPVSVRHFPAAILE